MFELIIGAIILAIVYVLFRCIETWHDINFDD